MSIIADFMRAQNTGVALSKEEIEDIVDGLEESEIESDELDDQFDEVDAAQTAVATMESMVELISGLTGLSQESYVHSMSVVTGIARTAGLPTDAFDLTTEDSAEETPEQRKITFADKAKGVAGKVKDAAIEGIKRLFAMLRDFIMKFFDRIEKLGKTAKAQAEAIKANGPDEISEIPVMVIEIMQGINELKKANEQIGGKSIEAIRQLKVGGDNTAAYDALRGVTGIKLPKLFGNPQLDAASGQLKVEWPTIDYKDRGGVAKKDRMVATLETVATICETIKNHRSVLKGSALSASEVSLSRVFGAEEQAKQFSAALKMINGVYKSWVSYVGRVCNEVVKASSSSKAKPKAEGQEAKD